MAGLLIGPLQEGFIYRNMSEISQKLWQTICSISAVDLLVAVNETNEVILMDFACDTLLRGNVDSIAGLSVGFRNL